jgi:hypothetical protein
LVLIRAARPSTSAQPLKIFGMLAPSCSFPGWTIVEAIERTSDLDQSVNTLWERFGRAELVLIASFGTQTAPPAPIDPNDLSPLSWSAQHPTSLIGDVELFNVRVFPVLNAPNASVYLHGLSLAEAFRRYVLNDPEIVTLAKRLAQTGKGYSAVFVEGQSPGILVDYHWSLDSTAAALAYRFVEPLVSFVGDADPEPSAMITKVSEVLAWRLGGLRYVLETGAISATGTFVQTGIEVPIGRLQWGRGDLSIDVRSGDLCEGQEHRAVPKWTGLSLRLPEAPQPANQVSSGSIRQIADVTPKVGEQIQTKEKFFFACIGWLERMMSNPEIAPRSRDDLWAEAQLKWPGKLSERAFIKARDIAIANKRASAWKAPGRRPKSPHS